MLESVGLILNYGSTAAVNSMLIFMGKIGIIQNAICTIRTDDLMTEGVYLIRQRLHNTPDKVDTLLDDMNIILSALNQNEYSTEYSVLRNEDLVNTAAFIEASIYQETVEWIKSELERHHNHSQDELTFWATNLTSDMNLNGHTHSTEEEMNTTNTFQAFGSCMHHGSLKQVIMDVEDHHHSSSEELMTMDVEDHHSSSEGLMTMSSNSVAV